MSIVTPVKPEPNQLSPTQMMAVAERFAKSKTAKPAAMTLSLAIMAGLFIALAFVFYITVTTGNADLGIGVNKLLGGLAFSLGLILVVLCGGELFTSTVMSLISLVRKEVTLNHMLKVWGKVYLGNFIGASLLVMLVVAAKLHLNADGLWGLNALNVAQHKLHHTPLQAFSLGVLCNLLVCLAVWLTFCTTSNGTKALLMVLPVALFVSSGFEHCIANLFMVPLGIAITQVADGAYWAQLGVDAAKYADLTWAHFIINNLIPVTLGNIVGGGVLVGLANYAIYRPLAGVNEQTHADEPATVEINTRLTVADVMNRNSIVLNTNTAIPQAMDMMRHAAAEFAPVVDDQQNLMGYLSLQQATDEIANRQNQPHHAFTVAQLMTPATGGINADCNLIEVTEQLKQQQRQQAVNENGILLDRSSHSNFDWQFTAVVEDNRVIGTISKAQLTAALYVPVAESAEAVAEPLAKSA